MSLNHCFVQFCALIYSRTFIFLKKSSLFKCLLKRSNLNIIFVDLPRSNLWSVTSPLSVFSCKLQPKTLHCGHTQYPAHWAPIPQVFQWLRVRTAHLMSCIYEDAWWNGSIKLVRTDSRIRNSSSWWKLVLRVWNPTILSPSFDPGEPWSSFIDIKQLILYILIWSIFVV